MIDSVKPEVLADFAAIRKAKRKGPVTAQVIEEICQQAHLAGMTLEQALQHCCHPERKWARFDASWMHAKPSSSHAATVPTPAAALWKPPVSTPAAPDVRAAGCQRLNLIKHTPPAPVPPVVGIELGAGPGWAHAIVAKHLAGQRVSRASLHDACIALKITPASLRTATH